jgi:hypothetical protein
MFRQLLGLRSFDSLKGFLVCKQVFFLIIFGGIKFILTTTITPTSYLRSWALMASIIVAKFMVDQCPFLLKAITWVNYNTFPFQQHFKVTCDLLSPLARTCFLLEHFIKQQMVQLQDSILMRLHHHTLFQHTFWWDIWNMSCSNLIMFWFRGGFVIYNSTNFPSLFICFPNLFHNASNMIWIIPSFNCKYPSMHVHKSHQLYGYPLFTLCSWQQAHKNPWCNS